MNINEIEEKLSQVLKPGRYRHSQGVAYTAANMAAVFDQNTEKAFRAGMLHDCAKGYSLKEQEGFCRTYGICLDDILPDSPQLMHSALAPHIAEEFYHNIILALTMAAVLLLFVCLPAKSEKGNTYETSV